MVLNQGKYLFKMSQLDKSINLITVVNIFFIAVMCAVVVILNINFINTNNLEWESLNGVPNQIPKGAYYIFDQIGDEAATLKFKVFFSCYLLFAQFVPF